LSKLLAAAFAAFVALLALAACGGSGETTPALTKAEFIAQGDEICAKGDEEGQEQSNEFAEENDIDVESPTEAQKEEVVLDILVPVLSEEAEKLGELGPPEGEEAEVEAMISALENAAEELEEEPQRAFSAADTPLKEASKLAKEFGFETCGG
jgi:hypothetical protein